jgi:hypothetical protein
MVRIHYNASPRLSEGYIETVYKHATTAVHTSPRAYSNSDLWPRASLKSMELLLEARVTRTMDPYDMYMKDYPKLLIDDSLLLEG